MLLLNKITLRYSITRVLLDQQKSLSDYKKYDHQFMRNIGKQDSGFPL